MAPTRRRRSSAACRSGVAVGRRGAPVMACDGSTIDTHRCTAPAHRPGRRDRGRTMHKYVIERDLPGAGELTSEDLQGIARTSVEVLDAMAGRAQWLET